MAHRFRTLAPRNTTAAGYGNEHMRARKQAAAQHQPSDPCARCHHALGPMGSHLHYDHNGTRTGYLGFSHGSRPCPVCGQRCNIVAGAREGNRRSRRLTIRRAQSRAW